jgi:hypothetical protein
MQTGRHGAGHVHRLGHHGPGRLQLGRHFTGIELSPAFARLAAERLSKAGPADRKAGQS